MRGVVRFSFLLAVLVAAPSAVFAQAAITGVVKDSSGAVLPGVSVEAASPALIEKARTAITDGSGVYRVEDLRPGRYTVTFSLSGFTTVKREGLELTGSFVATVNADLKVGAVTETITVTGETPIVDVVSAKKQETLSNEVISAVPTARLYHSIATLVPGVTVSGSQDVGGIQGPVTVTFAMRGGPGNEGRLTVDGLSLGASLNGTGVSYTVADVGNAQEVVFTTAGGLGESEVGGPAMNLVPRQGGNRFSYSFFGNFGNDSMQSSNYSDALHTAGLAAPQLLLKIWDVNGAVGGPIRKDRLWFFSAARYQGNRKTVSAFENVNANDLTKWNYVASTTQANDDGTWKNVNTRLTLQASPRNKFNVFWDEQRLCTSCMGGGSATVAPESRGNNHAAPRVEQITWSSPRTTRLLLEAGLGANIIDTYGVQGNISNFAKMIPVTENCNAGCGANGGIPNLQYRSIVSGTYIADSDVYNWRASAAIVTGSHSAKVGYIGQQIVNHFPNSIYNDYWLTYTFSNGRPFSFTQIAGPALYNTHVQTNSLFVQDQWAMRRVTLSGAIRYDHSSSFFPEQQIGPNPFILTPTILPAQDATSYNDITPRVAAAYDLFGNGKTALKVNVGKYLAAADGSSITGSLTNPINRLTTSSGARTWTDANGNFAVDCDLTKLTAQDNRAAGGDFCGQGNLAFGQLATPTTTYDPAILHGWRVRPYDWNFGVQVQQQLRPRVSVDVGYFRRIFGNFFVSDNRLQNTFDQFQVTAPADNRLPGSGGQPITSLYNVVPTQSGLTDNLMQKADNFGTQTQHWNGVEVNFNARVRDGLMLQGGTSTGRTTTDNCEIRAALPEIAALNPYCHVEPPFKTQVKGLASYTIPHIDVQVSSAFQSLPGGTLAANYAFPGTSGTELARSLGRPLSGNAQTASVNLVAPGTLYGDRINQIDLRIGRVTKINGWRTQFSVDLYNALNSAAVQSYNQTFVINGAWLGPTLIMPARFAKITVQVDF
jgi:hypothetical protein